MMKVTYGRGRRRTPPARIDDGDNVPPRRAAGLSLPRTGLSLILEHDYGVLTIQILQDLIY